MQAAAQELLAEMGCGLPQSSGSRQGTDVCQQTSVPRRQASWQHPGPDTPRTIPSACTGLLTGSDSCESTPAPVAAETGVKQGGKHCNYLLTRFHISLLSE